MTDEIIDSHQHFWRLETDYYGWLKPEAGVLHRNFEPPDLRPLLEKNGVSGTILVQAADTEAELDLLGAFAARSGFVLGIVAGLQAAHPKAAVRVRRMARTSRVVGFRPPISSVIDADGCVVTDCLDALIEIEKQALTLECLIRGDALAALSLLADRLPDLRLVINHCGAPSLDCHVPERQWRQAMASIARRPNSFCKISGLFTLLPPGTSRQIVTDHIAILMDLFGPERLMWGSDWPVLTQASRYQDWLEFCQSHFASSPVASRSAIFARTARRAYRLS